MSTMIAIDPPARAGVPVSAGPAASVLLRPAPRLEPPYDGESSRAAQRFGRHPSGEPAPGEPAPGEPAPGEPAPGEPAPGEPVPGTPSPGSPPAGPVVPAAPRRPGHGEAASVPVPPPMPQRPGVPAPGSLPAAPILPRARRPVVRPHPSRPLAPPPVGPPASHAQRVARRYVNLCLEVLGGFRPLNHLRRLTAAPTFDTLGGQLSPSRRPSDRIGLLHLRVCEPCEGVAEVAAVLGQGGWSWAMTLRLERREGEWLCTHLCVL